MTVNIYRAMADNWKFMISMDGIKPEAKGIAMMMAELLDECADEEDLCGNGASVLQAALEDDEEPSA